MHDNNDNITYLLNLELFRAEEVGDITMALSSISLAPRPNRFGLADTEGEARIAVFGEQGGGELHGELENDHLERYYSTRQAYKFFPPISDSDTYLHPSSKGSKEESA